MYFIIKQILGSILAWGEWYSAVYGLATVPPFSLSECYIPALLGVSYRNLVIYTIALYSEPFKIRY